MDSIIEIRAMVKELMVADAGDSTVDGLLSMLLVAEVLDDEADAFGMYLAGFVEECDGLFEGLPIMYCGHLGWVLAGQMRLKSVDEIVLWIGVWEKSESEEAEDRGSYSWL